MWAATREMGTEIYWEDCNFEEMVDHTCNTLDDLPGMNCKLFASEKGSMLIIDLKTEFFKYLRSIVSVTLWP